MKNLFILLSLLSINIACQKADNQPSTPTYFVNISTQVDVQKDLNTFFEVSLKPIIKLGFSTSVKKTSIEANILLIDETSQQILKTNISYEKQDSIIVIQPTEILKPLQKYSIKIGSNLLSSKDKRFENEQILKIITKQDTTNKFPILSDSALLDLVQRQTFKYFWNFAHPISGLARERNTSGDVVTSGGSGFGIMAMVVATERNFITRQESRSQLLKITDFLVNKADNFHGVFPHWLNGATGKTVAFSQKDNGADLVETSYLMQGLLTARQYFNDPTNAEEILLRKQINQLWNDVEWSWFRRDNEEKLYWHWSPNYEWAMNMPISGWNEALITYVLAASSNTNAISKSVYINGWAKNGAIKNGKTFYGQILPLGTDNGGPLFFSQYSFLGLNPHELKDQFADYWQQNVAHSLINYQYCKVNPRKYYGYNENCWGLTASDVQNGYNANEPNNDTGTISPTAALSAMPYTPEESKKALRYFYYKLGDKTFKQYGFIDAFNLSNLWFADSFLAIDQGPIIIMIENHRTGLLWKLFMSCPEIKTGLNNLGFQSSHL